MESLWPQPCSGSPSPRTFVHAALRRHSEIKGAQMWLRSTGAGVLSGCRTNFGTPITDSAPATETLTGTGSEWARQTAASIPVGTETLLWGMETQEGPQSLLRANSGPNSDTLTTGWDCWQQGSTGTQEPRGSLTPQTATSHVCLGLPMVRVIPRPPTCQAAPPSSRKGQNLAESAGWN